MSGSRFGGRNDDVQGELDELQRRYRLMEVSRRTYNEDSQNTIRMQRQQIDKLKKDNDRLKEDLSLETRQARSANNLSASAQISKLQDQADLYSRKIATERRRIEELDQKIARMKETILEQRKKMGGINASREDNDSVQKQIRILENRLDKALVKFNEALAHNKQLRETIDNLRRERLVFDGIYKGLEKELHEKKLKMAEIVEISNAAYEARDKAQAEMIALKAQADKEQRAFEEKWNRLGRLIERDRKMKDFLKVKERERSTSRNADPAQEEEQKLRKRVSKGEKAIDKDRAAIHKAMEKVDSYEEAFAKIQAATEISDIDELVQTFIDAEDQNFQLFNYVNDLSNEIEKLEESIAEIQEDTKKYKGQGVNVDNQRKKIMEDLESRLNKTESKANQYEQRYDMAIETVNTLKDGIQRIFDKLGCDADDDVMAKLGNAGVTESNMMQFLGIIEQRTNELLMQHATQRDQGDDGFGGFGMDDYGDDGFNSGGGSGNNRSHDKGGVSINPPSSIDVPSTGDYDDEWDEDEDDRPLTLEELKQKQKQRR
eukprot:TRINITY_DN62522_c0_g1_i1.p1 TRINITY_DN62522_c0_g1~~TRINITY_DN62522_c0_g1_i1.p1  ORF type:complete len:546 (-),score=352.04 TRINITY_DN62522_c0_g1_i1:483-2120(-)